MMKTQAQYFFPDVDPEKDNLKEAYQRVRHTNYSYIMLKPTIKSRNKELVKLLSKAIECKKKGKDKVGDRILKMVLVLNGNLCGAGNYILFENRHHKLFKHQVKPALAKFEMTEKDLKRKQDYIKVASLILPRLPLAVHPVPVRREREKSIKDIFGHL